MYARIETIYPKRAESLLARNFNNRKLLMSKVKQYATDIKNDAWEVNGESICIGKDGTLKDGQHRLMACVLANKPITVVVVYDVENNVTQYDLGSKRTTSNYFQLNDFPPAVCHPVLIGAIKMLLKDAGIKEVSNSQAKKAVEFFGVDVCANALSISRVGASQPLTMKAGCVAAILTSLYYGVDEKVISGFMKVVNTGFAENKSQFAAIVVRNFLQVQPTTGGLTAIKNAYFFTLHGIVDYKNGNPRTKKYDVSKRPSMAEAIRETLKEQFVV